MTNPQNKQTCSRVSILLNKSWLTLLLGYNHLFTHFREPSEDRGCASSTRCCITEQQLCSGTVSRWLIRISCFLVCVSCPQQCRIYSRSHIDRCTAPANGLHYSSSPWIMGNSVADFRSAFWPPPPPQTHHTRTAAPGRLSQRDSLVTFTTKTKYPDDRPDVACDVRSLPDRLIQLPTAFLCNDIYF